MKNKEVIFIFLFTAMVLALPFQKILNINFIPFGNHICVYFSIVAFILVLLFSNKNDKSLRNFAFKYFIIYILILSISFLFGFFTFDYQDLYVTAIGRNIEKVAVYCSKIGINIFADDFAVIIFAYKAIIREGIILGLITFGTTFWITWLFKNKWYDSFDIFRKCCVIIFSVCIAYSIIEFFLSKGICTAYLYIDEN